MIFKELLIASRLPPPALLISEALSLFEIDNIYIANSIAKKRKRAADKLNNPIPSSSKELENLLEISEPKTAPREPPAIITP